MSRIIWDFINCGVRGRSVGYFENDEVAVSYARTADIDSIINTLTLVDCLKDGDIEVLQTILAPISKGRKLTNPISRHRKPTKSSRQPTKRTSRPASLAIVQQKKEQIPKLKQEVIHHDD